MEQHPFKSSFHNVEPRTREERAAANSIAQKMQSMGQRNPAKPAAGTSHAVDELDRFKRDVAAELKMKKEQSIQKKQAVYQQKQEQTYLRDKLNWDRVIAAEERKEQSYARKRETSEGQNGQPHYNILSLDYKNTPQGQALRAKDDMMTQQAAMRSYNLYTKNNSGVNILTGEATVFPALRN